MPVIVSFVSQKGGVGKSTLARALAAVAAHAGLKVTLADLDAQQQTLVQWQKARKENKVSPKIAVSAFGGVADAVASSATSDLLILDTAGGVNSGTLTVAEHAHLVVQPTGPSLDDLYPTVLIFHELAGAGIVKSRLVAALCRVLTDDEEAAGRAYLEQAGFEVLPGSIPESAAFRVAQNLGQSLTEVGEKALNKRADALMEGLLVKVATILAANEVTVGTKRRASKGDAA
jgi:chromosome partitioning protein